MINEFHLFAGIGGGIYGGILLGHHCCAGVEIDEYCKTVLKQRQEDGWMEKFPIYGDITKLDGKDFIGKFDVLCGGFPCQAFSYAAHGNNIEEKNLWPEMFRFVQESDAPIVFGENVTIKAIEMAKDDLEKIGYKVERCRVACMDIGADHKRPRFWLLAVKDDKIFTTSRDFSMKIWEEKEDNNFIMDKKIEKGVGNIICAIKVDNNKILTSSAGDNSIYMWGFNSKGELNKE